MKKGIFLGLIILILLGLSGCSTSRQNVVGVMNMDRVLTESKRAAALQQELMDVGNKLEDRYKEQEEGLSSEDEGKAELDSLYQEYLDNKERLERQLNTEINQAIVQITEEKKLDIVLTSAEVFYGGLNITDSIIEILDKDGDSSE